MIVDRLIWNIHFILDRSENLGNIRKKKNSFGRISYQLESILRNSKINLKIPTTSTFQTKSYPLQEDRKKEKLILK